MVMSRKYLPKDVFSPGGARAFCLRSRADDDVQVPGSHTGRYKQPYLFSEPRGIDHYNMSALCSAGEDACAAPNVAR